MSAQNFFKEKTGTKPKWCIVEADESMHICTGMTVIPWTGFEFPEKRTRHILSGENKAGINSSSDHDIFSF